MTTETITQKPNYTLDHNEENITINVALPSVDKKTINLSGDKNTLTLTASRSNKSEDNWQLLGDQPLATELKLKLKINTEFDPIKATAKLDLNILQITIPKKIPFIHQIDVE